MSNSNQQSAMAEFFSECEEILQRVNSILTDLEKGADVAHHIDSLYRDIHTLKGSSQLFGFKRIGLITHAIEASLEPVRSKKYLLSPELIDLIFKGLDLVDKIVKNPDLDLKNSSELIEKTDKLIPELVQASLNSIQGDWPLPPVEPLMLSLAEEDKKTAKQKSKPAPVAKAKNVDLIQQAAKLADEFNLVKSGDKETQSRPSSEKVVNDKVANNVDPYHLTKTVETQKENPLAKVEDPKKDSATKMAEPINKSEKAPAPQTQGALDLSADHQTANQHTENSTIRVHVTLLDKLMNLMGEMVLVRNQVLQHAGRQADDFEFQALTQRLDLVTSELQEDVMRTRMQPIGSILSKFNRVVRDLAKDLKKQIEIHIEGQETELDKSLLEAIKDPLTHIIRNACDHGLETPDERKASGKAETGLLSISAFHEGGQVVIAIQDDGRGLNLKRIKQKAIEKQIITPEKAALLTDAEAAQLIFAPGFSTAEQVSSVSGRGVGMDVVKTNIEKVGGLVELSSTEGRGTLLKLRIPLTLAIVPAMIVRSGGLEFAIPQVKLRELLRAEAGDPFLENLQGKLIYRLRGQILPLLDLKETLKLEEKNQKQNSLINQNIKDAKASFDADEALSIAVLNGDGHTFGLVVDEIKDTADIVVKPLPKFLKKIACFSGATIMGDGSLALIVDVRGLAEKGFSKLHQSKSSASEALMPIKAASEKQEFLMFTLDGAGLFAMPLVLVQRLEEFTVKEIEETGGEKVVRYRDSLLPLINIKKELNLNSSNEYESDILSVIVVSKKGRLFGLAVKEILDVIQYEGSILDPLIPKFGVIGNILDQNKVATVIDALGLIEGVMTGHKNIVHIKNHPEQAGNRAGKALRVLYAEDTAFFARQVKKILSEMGAEVMHFSDGEAAFNKAKNSLPVDYDLIISDIEMPKMNGYELAESIRGLKGWDKIPMIAVTTRFTEADIKRGKASGFNFYLEKLKADQLLETIKTAVQEVRIGA